MATTLTAEKQLERVEPSDRKTAKRPGGSPWPNLGVRARQIALITLLVALVVVVTTAVNVAHLTGVIISRTKQEASQLSKQIEYAVGQELARNRAAERPLDEYTAVVSETSSVRGLMESTIVTSHTIAFLYLTNVSDQLMTDADGRHELAANRHMIGDVASERPDLDVLAEESGYVQLARVLFGPPIYEYRKPLIVKD